MADDSDWMGQLEPVGTLPLGSPGVLPEEPDSESVAAPQDDAATEDWMQDLRPAVSPMSEKIGAAAETGLESLSKTSGLVAGGMAGAALGFKAGMLTGPAAPILAPGLGLLGGVAGAAGGYYLGDESYEGREISKFPKHLRPYAVMGEVIGSDLPFVAAPMVAGATGFRFKPGRVGRYLNSMLETAAAKPVGFAATELNAIGVASAAAGASEAYFPGNDWLRFGAEVTAGTFNLGRLSQMAWRGGREAIQQAFRSLRYEGRLNTAAKHLQRLANEVGDDPLTLADDLLRPGPLGPEAPGITAGQRTGSPTFTALESFLSERSKKFGHEHKKRFDNYVHYINESIRTLREVADQSTNPDTAADMLVTAARVRDQHFRTLLRMRADAVTQQAQSMTARITSEAPGAVPSLSKELDTMLNDAFKDGRKVESTLWGRVPKETEAVAANLFAQERAVREMMLETEDFPPQLAKQLDLLRERDGATTVGELLKIRSRFLALARDAASGSNPDSLGALTYGRLAEGILDDLSAVPDAGHLIDDARSYSRQFNDVWTRTFAHRAMETTASGAERIPPELLIDQALGGGANFAEVKMREINEALQFLPDMKDWSMEASGLSASQAIEATKRAVDLQERAMRIAASSSVNPHTGQVDPTKLSGFIRAHRNTLERFPDLMDDLNAAVTSEDARRKITRLVSGATKSLERRTSFGRVLQGESPVDAIQSAVGSHEPIRRIQGMIQLAKRGGPEATLGLETTMWDYAFRRATMLGKDMFDLNRFEDALFAPISPNRPSMIDLMVREKVITPEKARHARTLVSEWKRAATSMRDAPPVGESIEHVDPVFDVLVRYTGAGLGGAAATGGMGHGIQAANIGSSAMRDLMEKVPIKKMEDLLIQAATDPEFGAMLLRRDIPKDEFPIWSAQMYSYLWGAGLTRTESFVFDLIRQDDEEQGTEPQGPPQPQWMQQLQ